MSFVMWLLNNGAILKNKRMYMRMIEIVIIIFLCGCSSYGVVKIQSPPQSINASVPAGLIRVIFFNTTNPSFLGHPTGLNGSVQLALNGKWCPNIEKLSYLQLYLEPGKYEVTLEHTDPFAYKDVYELIVGGEPDYVRIFRRIASNGFEVVDELPGNFEKNFKSTAL